MNTAASPLTEPALLDPSPIDLTDVVLPPEAKAKRYTVRLAKTQGELAQAQRLRYQSLFAEKGGKIDEDMAETGREQDQWDPIAWHVVALDSQQGNRVVGTLRLTASFKLAEGQALYTEQAFDLSALRGHYPRLLELSRFCIDSEARGSVILLLIWRYAMQLIIDNQFDVMLGCASFAGCDVEQHREILSWLHQHKRAPDALQPTPVSDSAINIETLEKPQADWELAKESVPPLLRGYLRLGAKISDWAIIDPVFNTVFVAIYVDAAEMLASDDNLVSR